jgi:hypothetical protein
VYSGKSLSALWRNSSTLMMKAAHFSETSVNFKYLQDYVDATQKTA